MSRLLCRRLRDIIHIGFKSMSLDKEMVRGKLSFLTILALSTGVLLMVSCSGGGEPETLTFDLEIKDREVVGDSVIDVKKDDTVVMRWSSDEPVEVHVHGYELLKDITPGEVGVIEFVANAEGRYPIEGHYSVGTDHQDEHGNSEGACNAVLSPDSPTPEVSLSVTPMDQPGILRVAVEVENFEIGTEPGTTGFSVGHWHLYSNGELQGMYLVPEALVSATEPGEHTLMVTLTDNSHCEYPISAMTTVTLETSSDDEQMSEDGHSHDEQTEDVGLMFLEVNPR